MLLTDTITGSIPHADVNVDHWDLANVNLADPEFTLSRPVDMLLGISVMFDIMRSGNRKIGDHLPLMQNTTLGWVIGGGNTYLKTNQETATFINENAISLVSREWTEEESTCEQLFVETTSRSSEGRFVVRLPRKQNVNELGDSKSLALDKFLKLESRFDTDPSLKQRYNNFMEEYLTLGHMSKVTEDELSKLAESGPLYILQPSPSSASTREYYYSTTSSLQCISSFIQWLIT